MAKQFDPVEAANQFEKEQREKHEIEVEDALIRIEKKVNALHGSVQTIIWCVAFALLLLIARDFGLIPWKW